MSFSLSNVITTPAQQPPRIIFYSPEGVGKTTWAAAAPRPIFIQTEKGQGRLKIKACPLAQSFSEVVGWIGAILRDKHNYQTVVLDTLSRLEQLIHAEIRQEHGNDVFANYGKGYKLVPPYFERLIKGLNMLQDAGMMVIVLAHAEIKRFEPPGLSPYDMYQLNVHEKIRDMMFQWSDICLFGNTKTYTTEQKGSFNQSRTVATGGEKRFIYTQERPTHRAKNRYDLPYEIPLEKPFDWDKFLKMIGNPPPWRKGEEQIEESEVVTSEATE